jgi:alcohol dehydrogenase
VISGVGQSPVGNLTAKSVTLCFELMFTRAIFAPPDMAEQHRILNEVARLVDAGTLKTTARENFGRITAINLMRAHAFVESGKAIGKVVLEGF